MADTIVRGGTLVGAGGRVRTDIRIEGELIAEIGPELTGGDQEIDARGLHVFPGLIDVHVHFNEPGRTEWEGGATGSRCACSRRRHAVLRHAAELDAVHGESTGGRSQARGARGIVDYRFRYLGRPDSRFGRRYGRHGRTGCGRVSKRSCAIPGFLSFPAQMTTTLEEGMHEAARLNLPVAVHAENEEMTRAARRRDAWRHAARLRRLSPGCCRSRSHYAAVAARRRNWREAPYRSRQFWQRCHKGGRSASRAGSMSPLKRVRTTCSLRRMIWNDLVLRPNARHL